MLGGMTRPEIPHLSCRRWRRSGCCPRGPPIGSPPGSSATANRWPTASSDRTASSSVGSRGRWSSTTTTPPAPSACWHPLRGTFKTVDSIRPGFARLQDTGHLIRVEDPAERKPGRPSSARYRVNPHFSHTWGSMTNITKTPNTGHFGHAIGDSERDLDGINAELSLAADDGRY